MFVISDRHETTGSRWTGPSMHIPHRYGTDRHGRRSLHRQRGSRQTWSMVETAQHRATGIQTDHVQMVSLQTRRLQTDSEQENQGERMRCMPVCLRLDRPTCPGICGHVALEIWMSSATGFKASRNFICVWGSLSLCLRISLPLHIRSH